MAADRLTTSVGPSERKKSGFGTFALWSVTVYAICANP